MVFCLKVMLLCLPALSANGQRLRASITVDALRVTGKISRGVFGNNYIGYQKGAMKNIIADYYNAGAGVWDPVAGKPAEGMVALAREAGVTVARYPGGTIVHNFDWKKTIGPPAERPEQKFGLPEFLRFCDSAMLTPMITLADYKSSPQDAADLLEYLNSPDDGKHPFAARRAADGRKQPWNVALFEYGNENDLDIAPEDYARAYCEVRAAMLRADKKVKIGFTGATSFPDLNDWFLPALRAANPAPDFIVHHCYLPDYQREDGVPPANELFALSLSAEGFINNYYREMNALILKTCKRAIPLAVTEYNGLFVQEKPVQYRLTLGNALLNAMMLFSFMTPGNNIQYANSWHFANEYWGAVKGYPYKKESVIRRPLFYVLSLLGKSAGKSAVKVSVVSPAYDSPGGYGVPGSGESVKANESKDTGSMRLSEWELSAEKSTRHSAREGILQIDFAGGDVNYYHAAKRVRCVSGIRYRVSGYIRAENLAAQNGVCLEVLDGRGWNATRSAARSRIIRGSSGWQKVSVDFVPLPGAKEILIRARRFSGAGEISGTASFRDITVEKAGGAVPSSPYISAFAAKGKDTLILFILNKHLSDSVDVDISVRGGAFREGTVQTLRGASIISSNEDKPDNVSLSQSVLSLKKGKSILTVPPHSLTAVTLK